MRGLACRWFIVENAKIFRGYVNNTHGEKLYFTQFMVEEFTEIEI